MRKLLSILFFVLIATLSFASKPTVTTYFDDTPWSDTYANKFWLDAESKSHMVRQVFYSTYDRCIVVGLQQPWYEQQYTLACGWATCKNLRQEGATNTLQLLRDITATDQVFSIQYCVAKDVQNTGAGFAMSNAPVAIDAKTFWALDQALMNVVTHYIPYGVYDSITSFSNVPTYCNLGAVLYEYDEYQDLVTDITWDDSHKYIKSCKWTWGTNSLPHPVSADPIHDTATSLVLLSALDCRAKIITMLKYPRYDGIPCAQGGIFNLAMTTGWGDSGSTDTTAPDYGDYGIAGDPLGFAYLACSHDTAWATASPTYTTAGKEGTSWTAQGNAQGNAKSSVKNSDWPTTGWQGTFDYHVDVDLSRDSAPEYIDWFINGTVNANTKWSEHESGWLAPDGVSTYTDTINGHYSGGAPYSIDANWDSESQLLIVHHIDGYYSMAGTDVTTTTITNTSPSTNIVSDYAITYGWSNLVAGTSMGDKLYTYAYLGGTFFEFTNDNPKASTEFTNLCSLYYWYSITTKVDSVYTTNTVTTHTTPEPPGDWVPPHDEYWGDGYISPVPTSGSWDLALDGDAKCYLEAMSAIYDSRPDLDIVITKLDKDHNLTSMKCYALGMSKKDIPTYGVLGYDEWQTDYSDIAPFAAGDGLTSDAIKLMGAGTYNSKFHMYYWNLGEWGYEDPYSDYYTSGPARIFWGVKRTWWIAEYNFPKRKSGDLPLPKSE